VVTALAALLALFHVRVLAGQAWDGQLADPGVIARWLLAGGLTWALFGLRRSGPAVVPSRKAVALWVLAAVLHGPAVADRLTPDAPSPYLPETATFIVEIVAASAALGVGMVLLAWLVGRLFDKASRTGRRPIPTSVSGGSTRPTFVSPLAPRPPPLPGF
jgi:hypothetical protein